MIHDKLALIARYRQATGFFWLYFAELPDHGIWRLVNLAVAYYHDPERFA